VPNLLRDLGRPVTAQGLSFSTPNDVDKHTIAVETTKNKFRAHMMAHLSTTLAELCKAYVGAGARTPVGSGGLRRVTESKNQLDVAPLHAAKQSILLMLSSSGVEDVGHALSLSCADAESLRVTRAVMAQARLDGFLFLRKVDRSCDGKLPPLHASRDLAEERRVAALAPPMASMAAVQVYDNGELYRATNPGFLNGTSALHKGNVLDNACGVALIAMLQNASDLSNAASTASWVESALKGYALYSEASADYDTMPHMEWVIKYQHLVFTPYWTSSLGCKSIGRKVCSVELQVNAFTLCVPAVCEVADIQALLDDALLIGSRMRANSSQGEAASGLLAKASSASFQPKLRVVCQPNATVSKERSSTVSLGLGAMGLLLAAPSVLLGSVSRMPALPKGSEANLGMSQAPNSRDELGFLHGVRVISITGIAIFHFFASAVSTNAFTSPHFPMAVVLQPLISFTGAGAAVRGRPPRRR